MRPIRARWWTLVYGLDGRADDHLGRDTLRRSKVTSIAHPASPNTAPVATNDTYMARANKQFVAGANSGVLLNDTDLNADFLTAIALSQPAHGKLQFNSNGSFLYKPVAGYVGPDSFTYQASDGIAVSNIAIVDMTVQ